MCLGTETLKLGPGKSEISKLASYYPNSQSCKLASYQIALVTHISNFKMNLTFILAYLDLTSDHTYNTNF